MAPLTVPLLVVTFGLRAVHFRPVRWPPSAFYGGRRIRACSDETDALDEAIARVHAAAAAFGGEAHFHAAVEYTTALLDASSGTPSGLLDRQKYLFDDPEQCLPLRVAMDNLRRLVAERSTAATVLRLVLDVRIDQAVATVRALAAEFGSLDHARAAVEWTERLVQAGAEPGGAEAVSHASLRTLQAAPAPLARAARPRRIRTRSWLTLRALALPSPRLA